MQVKPRFENFKIVKSYPIITDDIGNQMCLCLIEVKPNSDDSEIVISSYKCWTVIGTKITTNYKNGAVGYNSNAYWKNKKLKRKLIKTEIENIKIEEKICGEHSLFGKYPFEMSNEIYTEFVIKLIEK